MFVDDITAEAQKNNPERKLALRISSSPTGKHQIIYPREIVAPPHTTLDSILTQNIDDTKTTENSLEIDVYSSAFEETGFPLTASALLDKSQSRTLLPQSALAEFDPGAVLDFPNFATSVAFNLAMEDLCIGFDAIDLMGLMIGKLAAPSGESHLPKYAAKLLLGSNTEALSIDRDFSNLAATHNQNGYNRWFLFIFGQQFPRELI
jgi:hypothetical protein